MKRFFTFIVAAALSSMPILAQDINGFMERLSSECLCFDFSTDISEDTPITAEGSVQYQYNGYKVSGNGIEIISDFKSRWIMDYSAREAIVENDKIGDPYENLMPGDYNSASITLIPAIGGTGIKTVELLIDCSDISKARITMTDGKVTSFKISNVHFAPPVNSIFSVNEKSLGDGWIVTDLR